MLPFILGVLCGIALTVALFVWIAHVPEDEQAYDPPIPHKL
jgi:cytoskeletal protein RodZ